MENEKNIFRFLDHYALLSWCSYMSHRIDVGKPNKNFDDRDFVRLPSGRKVVITIDVQEYDDEKEFEKEVQEYLKREEHDG